ncbi:MAG: response regulator [Kiloniellales bacterium]
MSARATWSVLSVLAMLAFGSLAGAFVYAEWLNSDYARLQELKFGELLWSVEQAEQSGLQLHQIVSELQQADVVGQERSLYSAAGLALSLETVIGHLRDLDALSASEDFSLRYGQHAAFRDLLGRLEALKRDLNAGTMSEQTLQALEAVLAGFVQSLNSLSLIVMERTDGLSEEVSAEIETLMILGAAGLVGLVLCIVLLLRINRKIYRRMGQAELSKEQVIGALNTLGHGFAYFDADDRLVLYNDWYRRTFSLPVKEGMTFEETIRMGLQHGLYPNPDAKGEEWIAERMRLHRHPEGPLQMQFANGRWLQVDERATGDGGRAGLRFDITEWKVKEEALKADLQQREAYLSALRRATSLPSSVLDHMLTLLAKERDAERSRVYLETAFQAHSLISRMIEDLPLLADPTRGALGLVAVDFETERLWQTPMAFLGASAETSGVTLKPTPDANLPQSLKGDVTRLLQVIVMLLDLALAEADGGQLSLGFSLAVPQGSASSALLLRCEIGLSDRAPSRERWSTLLALSPQDFNPDSLKGGSGLILARRLAEAMGGRLRLGEGFVFEAPVSRIPMPMVTSGLDRDRPLLDQSVLRFEGDPSVLIVEDDRINQRLILAYLSRMGVKAEAVADGAAAVERAAGTRFDLILMDIVLPELDGLGATEAIRSGDGACRDTPILALTANAKPIQVEHCLSAGMNGHIAKPVDPVRLLQAMQRWMKVSRVEENSQPRSTGPEFDDPLDAAALDDLVAGAGGALATELIGDFLTDLDARMEALHSAAKDMDSATLVKVCHSIKGSAGLFGASELADLAAQIEEEAKHLSRGEAFRLISELSTARDRSRDAYGSWQARHGTGLDAIDPP